MRAILLLVLIGLADFIFSIAAFTQQVQENFTQEKILYKEILNETEAAPQTPAAASMPVASPVPTLVPTPTPMSPTPTPASTSTPTSTCTPNWQCGSWGLCINDKQNRTCTDGCAAAKTETQNCNSVNHVMFAEILYDTPGSESDEEWIKLYNPAAVASSLVNWSVSDNSGMWKFSVEVGTKSYLTIARSSSGFRNLTGCSADIVGFTRGLNNDGDYLVLRDAAGGEIDFVAWEKGGGSYPQWNITAQEGKSVRRVFGKDTDSVGDWIAADPQPCG